MRHALILLAAASLGGQSANRTPLNYRPLDEGRCTVIVTRVIDGDTVEVYRLVGPERCRLLGIDAPEMRGQTQSAGIAARDFLRSLIGDKHAQRTGEFHGVDHFGRSLVRLYDESGADLAELLIDAGHALAH